MEHARTRRSKPVDRLPVTPDLPPDEVSTELEHARFTVAHDAATEMMHARAESADEAGLLLEEGESQATTARVEGRAEERQHVETQKNILEKAHALTYAIHARIQQLEQEREKATQWWKFLDRAYRNAGARQQRLREIQTEIAALGSTLHHPSVQQETLARIATLEKELYETHTVPEILAAPSAEYEGEPIMHTEFAGAMKTTPDYEQDRLSAGKLGEYGQDGKRINESSGTTIVFDGVNLYEDSFHVGEIVAEKIEEILHGLPDTKDRELIERYIQERLPELSGVLMNLPKKIQGSAAVVATRYLPRAEMLVCIKVGDGEIVLEDPSGAAQEILPNDPTRVKVVESIGITNSAIAGSQENNDLKTVRKPTVFDARIAVVPVQKATRVYTTTDGVYNNTGKHLIEHVANGSVHELMQALPRPSEGVTVAKDDMMLVKQQLSKP